jgi:Ribosomal protein L11 methyltransferase (PrmA)
MPCVCGRSPELSAAEASVPMVCWCCRSAGHCPLSQPTRRAGAIPNRAAPCLTSTFHCEYRSKLHLISTTLEHTPVNMLHVTSASIRLQVDSMYDEFSGRSVIDLGCGTVRTSYSVQRVRCNKGASQAGLLDRHQAVACWVEQAMLAIGAAMLGATHVLAVDCDEEALEVAAENRGAFDDLPVSSSEADTTPC